MIGILIFALGRSALAQSVGTGSGPVSEMSRSVKSGSRPVHERGHSVSDGTVGSMKSGPVRGDRRVGMLSGPVSDISVGPVTAGQSMTGGGSMTENSAGAVKHEMDPSLGEQVYDLQRALGPLQARLREQAEADAAAAADEAAHADAVAPRQDVEPEQPESREQVQLGGDETAGHAVEHAEPEAPVAADDAPQPAAEDENIGEP